jgi:outer membrane protein TolC
MRKLSLPLTLALLARLTGSTIPELHAQEPLTLVNALAQALEHNPELAVDAPMREAADAGLAASRAGYLPRIDFEQSYTGGNNPVYVFGTLLTQRRFTAANFALSSLNNPNALDNLQTKFSARADIWDFGRTRQHVEDARLGIEVTDRGHEDHVRQVLLATLDAYYSVSLARDGWSAAKTSLESAESIVKQAEARVQSGMAVEADLLRGQVYLASARQREIESRGQLEMARSRLNRLMGKSVTAPLGETAPLKPVSMPVPAEEALKAEQAKRRPDYKRLQAEIRRAEAEVRSFHAEYLPSIGAFASWEMDNPSLHNYGGSNWTAGVGLRWNIFAGGADAARLRAARQRLEAKRRESSAMESGMALEIHNAMVQFRSAEQQVEAARAAEAQSEEGLRILKNRYEAGLATMTDVLAADSQRAAARAMLSGAIYRHRLSYAQIEYAAGTLSPTSTAMNP